MDQLLTPPARYNDLMKYSLRSLMMVALVLPPLLAAGWFAVVCFSPMERADERPGTEEEFRQALRKYEKYERSHK